MTKRKGLEGSLPPPTVGRVREVFDYNPETGILRWRVRLKQSKAKAGDVAGCLGGTYLQVRLDGRLCYVHQIAWLYMTGEWQWLDHRNLDRIDNRLCNLRPATRSQNNMNASVRKDNTSGLKGVSITRGKYAAKIQRHYQRIHLGTFDRPEDAHAAYWAVAKELFGEFARAG